MQARRPSPKANGPFAPCKYYRRLNDFQLIEKVPDLEGGSIRAVRAVDGIPLDIRAEELADRAGIGFARIGGTHDFPKFLDGILGLDNHRDDRSFRHELHQAAKERPFLMNVIETL